MVVQRTVNATVVGSNPTLGVLCGPMISVIYDGPKVAMFREELVKHLNQHPKSTTGCRTLEVRDASPMLDCIKLLRKPRRSGDDGRTQGL